jgi:hypothetical protein
MPDDVHNQYTSKNPPTISITSPRDRGLLASGTVEVSVATKSRFGIKSVEFYFDDQLVGDSNQFPFTGRFKIPVSVRVGSRHRLKTVAIDDLLNHGETEIEVTITQDKIGPEVIFLGPIASQRIPTGATVQILSDVKDYQSGVKVVEFFLDDQHLGFDETFPFEKSFTATGALGSHKLKIKAHDFHANITEKAIPLIFERERFVIGNIPMIGETTDYRSSVSVDIDVPEPELVEWLEAAVEQNEQIIFSERWESPTKFIQFQLLKNLRGPAKIQLYYKLKSEEKASKSAVKVIPL